MTCADTSILLQGTPMQGTAFTHASRIFAAVLILAAAQSCVMSQSRKTEADETARSVYAECEALRQSGSLKTHAAAVECALPRVVAAYEQSGYPFEDLIYIELMARRTGAKEIDAGDATEAEVQRDLQRLQTRIAAEEKRRLDIIEFGGHPKAITQDVLLEGLRALTPTPDATALAPPPSQSTPNCFAIGSSNRCQ